jgi:hypothetical protein
MRARVTATTPLGSDDLNIIMRLSFGTCGKNYSFVLASLSGCERADSSVCSVAGRMFSRAESTIAGIHLDTPMTSSRGVPRFPSPPWRFLPHGPLLPQSRSRPYPGTRGLRMRNFLAVRPFLAPIRGPDRMHVVASRGAWRG